MKSGTVRQEATELWFVTGVYGEDQFGDRESVSRAATDRTEDACDGVVEEGCWNRVANRDLTQYRQFKKGGSQLSWGDRNGEVIGQTRQFLRGWIPAAVWLNCRRR